MILLLLILIAAILLFGGAKMRGVLGTVAMTIGLIALLILVFILLASLFDGEDAAWLIVGAFALLAYCGFATGAGQDSRPSRKKKR
jgi:peptidoglycan/LPS O-acetylase OafA/YrhL